MIETISIQPKRKIAEIRLSGKYLELKRISDPENEKSFLYDCRGDPNQSKRKLPPAALIIQLSRWNPRCQRVFL